MTINIRKFLRQEPIIIMRDELYVAKILNTKENQYERKVLCQSDCSCINDILFASPNYWIKGDNKYTEIEFTAVDLVYIDKFLEALGYPEGLTASDIRKIYHRVLSSTRALYSQKELFGVQEAECGYKCKKTYIENYLRPGKLTFNDFHKLESAINLPINPSDNEKNNNDKTYEKKMIFIS